MVNFHHCLRKNWMVKNTIREKNTRKRRSDATNMSRPASYVNIFFSHGKYKHIRIKYNRKIS